MSEIKDYQLLTELNKLYKQMEDKENLVADLEKIGLDIDGFKQLMELRNENPNLTDEELYETYISLKK